MKPFLQATDITKRFGAATAVDGATFSIQRGECLVLLGPSGCGKTTLLNIIAGMLPADGGTLTCDGVVMDRPAEGVHQPMRERQFSMVFQDFALWPHMSVDENVAFGLKVRGIARGERRRLVAEALAQVRMDEYGARRPGDLSGGQQQRVAIARALVVRPRLLLMDEPLSALDARLRDDLKTELAGLLRQYGTTTVYVTHDQSEAFALASRIALMNRGRIEQIGPPESVYRQPATAFAAAFLGVSNLFGYRRHNGALHLDDGTELPWNGPALPERGQLMLRREAVSVHTPDASAGADELSLPGVCCSTRFLGDRHEALVRVGNTLTLRGFVGAPVPEGAPVRAHFRPESVHVVPDER